MMVVNAVPRPLFPWEISGTQYVGGWVGTIVGLDMFGKFRPHRDSNPGPSSP
jgi:hypothetical protein